MEERSGITKAEEMSKSNKSVNGGREEVDKKQRRR